MLKILAAFVLGVAVTIGVFYAMDEIGTLPADRFPAQVLADKPPIERRSEVESLDPTTGLEIPTDQSNALSSTPTDTGDLTSSTAPTSRSPLNTEFSGESVAKVSRVPEASAGLSNHYQAPKEIAAILKDKVPDELHEQYESESKEESWSSYMEGQIAAYLGSKPALLTFEIALVDCRTSICEIHAIGYGPKAYAVWTNEIADITEQNWFEFTGMSGSASNAAPDIIGIVVVLHKNNS